MSRQPDRKQILVIKGNKIFKLKLQKKYFQMPTVFIEQLIWI
jgi:hypothetical protein